MLVVADAVELLDFVVFDVVVVAARVEVDNVFVLVVVVAFGSIISHRIPVNPYGHTQSNPPNVPK